MARPSRKASLGLMLIAIAGEACGGRPVAPIAIPTADASDAAASPLRRSLAQPCDEAETASIPIVTLSQRSPKDWNVVGQVVLKPSQDTSPSMELRDASGALVESHPTALRDLRKLTGAERESARHAAERELARGVCRLGGAAGVLQQPSTTPTTTTTVVAFAPAHEDARADLDRLCKAPADGPASFRSGEPWNGSSVASEKAWSALALGTFDENVWLTTRQWRGWRRSVEAQVIDDSAPHDARIALARQRASELDRLVKPKGYASCWYVDLLRALE